MVKFGSPIRYKPCYVKCPTGRYILAGTIPAYFEPLLFTTEEIAKQALAEARQVLETGQVSDDSIFAQAYLNGSRVSGHVIVQAP